MAHRFPQGHARRDTLLSTSPSVSLAPILFLRLFPSLSCPWYVLSRPTNDTAFQASCNYDTKSISFTACITPYQYHSIFAFRLVLGVKKKSINSLLIFFYFLLYSLIQIVFYLRCVFQNKIMKKRSSLQYNTK